MEDSDADAYEPMPIEVIGIDVPEDGDIASIWVVDKSGKKIALQIGFQDAGKMLLNASRAFQMLGYRSSGGHLPVIPAERVEVTSDQDRKTLALHIGFGQTGIVGFSLSANQASEAARKIQNAASRLGRRKPRPH
ncbi:hypothetical protein [Mesorhizobium helmanticense]|uniref:Uncharacterized protein n=1 Tax=Mesorhizobium helmanticense TaxID=1776423 RepID=A0A2T4IP04_9HYPH|nr:hypothetical protein [Mesorhizobium helmanticense]PTE07391.1 hypothetical protein C9427_27210 [Mesorhizobium helmanticense]